MLQSPWRRPSPKTSTPTPVIYQNCDLQESGNRLLILISPCFMRCTAQAIVITLQLSGQLRLGWTLLHINPNNLGAIKTVTKICRHPIQAIVNKDGSLYTWISSTNSLACLSKPVKIVMIQRSCSDGNLCYLHPHRQPRKVDMYLILHRKRGSLLIITKNTMHKCSLCFLQNGDTYSHA